MDREFIQTFREDSEEGMFQSNLSEVNDRYERLKLKSNKHTQQIIYLLSLHEKYHYSVEQVMTWIEEIQLTVENATQIQPGPEQIEALKVRSD